jgi:phosphatidylserine/phosphatidylglycerophosphate/cardiolipin synthase-like enzyme
MKNIYPFSLSTIIIEEFKKSQSYLFQEETLYILPKDKEALENKIINLIDSSKECIDISMYNLKYKKFIDSLIKASKRGVKVRVIFDREKVENNSKVFNLFKNNNIDVKASDNKLHMKIAIFDRTVYTSGSLNWKDEPFTENNYEIVKLMYNESDIKRLIQFIDSFFENKKAI